MFRISSLKLISEENETDTIFDTNKQHILYYAGSSKGKTVFLKVVNYLLAGSESIKLVDGIKNVQYVKISIIFDDITLYVIRNISKENDIKYSLDNKNFNTINLKEYKVLLSKYLSKNNEIKTIEQYKIIIGQSPSIRSFSFLNYIDENNIGDPKNIFHASNYGYSTKIRDIMNFLFNDNSLDIANKQLELKELKNEKNKSESYEIAYKQYMARIHEAFSKLKIDYKQTNSIDDLSKIYNEYKTKNSFKIKKENSILDQLLQKKYELEEELKNINILKQLIDNGKNKYNHNILLLELLKNITPDNKSYIKYHNLLINEIEKNQSNLFIFNSSNLSKQETDIKQAQKEIQIQIRHYKNTISTTTYEEYLDTIGIINTCLKNLYEINSKIKLFSSENLKKLEKDIQNLKKDFNDNSVTYLNDELNSFYKNNLKEIDFIKDDIKDSDLTFSFDPNKISIHSTKKDNSDFFSGSKARATVLQVILMLLVHKYIQQTFPDLPVMPILMFDTIDQPFDNSNNFNIFYNEFIKYADQINVQTIITTKTSLNDIPANVEILELEKFNKFFDE